jgi:hypothetical protein
MFCPGFMLPLSGKDEHNVCIPSYPELKTNLMTLFCSYFLNLILFYLLERSISDIAKKFKVRYESVAQW